MSINKKPDSVSPATIDYPWQVTKEFRDEEGYINSKKVEVSFFDLNDDGSVDDPDIFDNVVAPQTNSATKYIFLKKESSDQGFSKYNYYSQGSSINVVTTETEIGAYSQYSKGQVFYIIDNDNFKVLNNNKCNFCSSLFFFNLLAFLEYPNFTNYLGYFILPAYRNSFEEHADSARIVLTSSVLWH